MHLAELPKLNTRGEKNPKSPKSHFEKWTEQEAIYRFSFYHPKYLNFFSEENVNNMGVNRGYRIDIGDMVIKLYPKDWALKEPLGTWTKRLWLRGKKPKKQALHFIISAACTTLLSTSNAHHVLRGNLSFYLFPLIRQRKSNLYVSFFFFCFF